MRLSKNFLFKPDQNRFHLIDPSIPWSAYTSINLSAENSELETIDTSSTTAMQAFIDQKLVENAAQVGYGGYLEKRNIYQRSAYFKPENPEDERNIHLGVDFWAPEGTLVVAPFDGFVHSFQNNTNFGDYGPTIILEHTIEGLTFFTLYGHLSLESLHGKSVGEKIDKHAPFATLGGSDVNGDYPPHLHFQVVLDLQGHSGDYPGVCAEKDLAFYRKNCPLIPVV